MHIFMIKGELISKILLLSLLQTQNNVNFSYIVSKNLKYDLINFNLALIRTPYK